MALRQSVESESSLSTAERRDPAGSFESTYNLITYTLQAFVHISFMTLPARCDTEAIRRRFVPFFRLVAASRA